jgi:hypothetical protein
MTSPATETHSSQLEAKRAPAKREEKRYQCEQLEQRHKTRERWWYLYPFEKLKTQQFE